MTQHLITTSMQPGIPISVSDEELLDLKRMGIFAFELPTELDQVPAPTPLVGKVQQTEVTSGGDSKAEAEPEADGGQA